MTLASRRNSQQFPTSTNDMKRLLEAYRNFAKRQLKRPLLSTNDLDNHILELDLKSQKRKSHPLNRKIGALYDAFCIYGVKKAKLVKKFEEKKLMEKIVKKISSGEEVKISCHVDLNYYDGVDISSKEFLKKIMIDSRDIVYQSNVVMKPLWTRESMNK